jgi:hypothetical protein
MMDFVNEVNCLAGNFALLLYIPRTKPGSIFRAWA